MIKYGLERHYEHLSSWERVRLCVAARARSDEVENQRLSDSAPWMQWKLRHHQMKELTLHTMTLIYVTEQLESVACHFFAQMQLREGHIKDHELMVEMAALSGVHAYCFQMRMLGWKKFCSSIGVDPDGLVLANHHGVMLKLCEGQMGEFAPTPEDLVEWLRTKVEEPGPLIDAESEYRSWRRLLEKATSDPPCLN